MRGRAFRLRCTSSSERHRRLHVDVLACPSSLFSLLAPSFSLCSLPLRSLAPSSRTHSSGSASGSPSRTAQVHSLEPAGGTSRPPLPLLLLLLLRAAPVAAGAHASSAARSSTAQSIGDRIVAVRGRLDCGALDHGRMRGRARFRTHGSAVPHAEKRTVVQGWSWRAYVLDFEEVPMTSWYTRTTTRPLSSPPCTLFAALRSCVYIVQSCAPFAPRGGEVLPVGGRDGQLRVEVAGERHAQLGASLTCRTTTRRGVSQSWRVHVGAQRHAPQSSRRGCRRTGSPARPFGRG